MNINTSLSTTQTFGILNVRSMGDRTISSLPTDVDDNLDNNNNNNKCDIINKLCEQPPGLTECSFSSSSSESSNYDTNSSKEIVVSLIEDKAVVTSCGDEGYEIIPTTNKSTINNNDIDKVHQTTATTTKITPPSSNKNMNNNPTIEVVETSTPSTSPPDGGVTSKRVSETSIYATLSSAADSIRTRQISIATQPTSNALSGSNSSNIIDENIEGSAITTYNTAATQQTNTNNNNNELITISNSNKTIQSQKLPRVQSDTVSEYYQWYENNVG